MIWFQHSTETAKQQTLPMDSSGVRIWPDLPRHLHDERDTDVFKKNLKNAYFNSPMDK